MAGIATWYRGMVAKGMKGKEGALSFSEERRKEGKRKKL
jgi:hypothetical protein